MKTLASTLAFTSGLAPYTGNFGSVEAWHLLRRTTFGADMDRVVDAAGMGLEATLNQLFTNEDLIGPPLNPDEAGDVNVPIGSTWIEAPYLSGFDVNPYRSRSIQSWQMQTYYEGGFSIAPKMSLFWHNHFSCSRDGDARFFYQYLQLLRQHAIGNFKQLVKDISTCGQMLIFLNGNSNTKNSPNENFARELLELYTLGKGPHVGSGDYTNYTEDDVRALSFALTGCKNTNNGSRDSTKQPGSEFIPSRHDSSDQQLSHRFGNAVIVGSNESAHEQVIDIIFSQQAAADYICRKLYRWFVYYNIDADIEANVIQPMAALMRQSNFELAPVLRTLLSSEHFFEARTKGAMIKSPIDHVIDLTRPAGFVLPVDLATKYEMLRRLTWPAIDQQQKLWEPPTVAGWKAYYQSPQYYRNWINASSLKIRANLGNKVAGNGWTFSGNRLVPDYLAYIEQFDNPSDPNSLVAEFVERLLPQPLEQAQLDALKDVLIPGLPDFEWTVEYNLYTTDPGNADVAESVSRKLKALAKALFNSAEINLS